MVKNSCKPVGSGNSFRCGLVNEAPRNLTWWAWDRWSSSNPGGGDGEEEKKIIQGVQAYLFEPGQPSSDGGGDLDTKIMNILNNSRSEGEAFHETISSYDRFLYIFFLPQIVVRHLTAGSEMCFSQWGLQINHACSDQGCEFEFLILLQDE